MIEINIKKNGHGYDVFEINIDSDKFFIVFENNLDLYWYYIPKDYNEEIKSFFITKENEFLYSIINDLYIRISEYNPFLGLRDIESYNIDYLKKVEQHKEKPLFKNNMISWHSDDDLYEDGSILEIIKEKEEFEIKFIQSKKEDFQSDFSVRFRNSGSRYDPFHIPFMIMYNELKTYDKDNNQIHMEEYLYNAKIRARKK